MRLACFFLLSLASLAGCIPQDYTAIRQSTLVPVPTMPPPVTRRGRADVQLGDSIATILGDRELRPNEDAALWLPRHQLDGSITVRASRWFAIRALGGAGLAQDATAAAPTDFPSPGGAAGWLGLGAIFTYLHESGLGLDVELDTTVAFVPSMVQAQNCRWIGDTTSWDYDGRYECGGWSDWRRDSDVVPMLAGTLRLVWAPNEWVMVYAGATGRNHPTNDATRTAAYGDADSEVSFGNFAVVVGAGAEFTIEDVFSIIPHFTWPVYGGPVDYGPTIGLSIRGRFGDGPGDDLPPWRAPEPEADAQLEPEPIVYEAPPAPPIAEPAPPKLLFENAPRPLWMH
jgi:hypothetical protein